MLYHNMAGMKDGKDCCHHADARMQQPVCGKDKCE